jgi:vancomycin permeability regulator SanA
LLRLFALVPAMGCCLFLQIGLFGRTDYRRPADVIVVFGCGVRADGKPSLALADRVRTGCALYREGLAPVIVMSGGYGHRRPVSEPTAMRRAAIELGVPAEAIVLDESGWSTKHTVENVREMAKSRRWENVLMVSHGYHLSRVKMLSHRAGLVSYTVPAQESRPLLWKHYYVQRELAAWLYHYFAPLL